MQGAGLSLRKIDKRLNWNDDAVTQSWTKLFKEH